MKHTKLKILFRVDAGGKVGLGHFFRSINLAQSLKERGHEVIFIHLPSDFWRNYKDISEYESYFLDEPDAENQTLEIWNKHRPDIFYVDGIITFSEEFITQIKKTGKVVFYQNISASKHLADVFILPSVHQKNDFFEPFNLSNTKVYKGLEYFTFNQKIRRQMQKKTTSPCSIHRIAITAGGSDPNNVLLSIYEMIKDDEILNKIRLTFFFGTDFLFKKNIPQIPVKGVGFELYDLEKITSNDMLIAAFGVSAYEFMYIGVPVIGFGHQQSNSEALTGLAEKTGGIFDLGLFDNLTRAKLVNTIYHFIEHPNLLVSQVNKAQKSLDIEGVNRVVTILEEL